MHNYRMYCYNLLSNIKFPHLDEEAIDLKYEIVSLKIEICRDFKNCEMGFSENKKCFFLKYSDLVYTIYKEQLVIEAITGEIEKIERSIGNIPISLLCITSNRFLLHSSSVILNKKLYAFVGEKGMGKSTLAYKMVHFNKAIPFSDDAILICGDQAYSRGNVFKIMKEDYENNDTYFSQYKYQHYDSKSNKVYLQYYRKICLLPINIDAIYFILRGDSDHYLVKDLPDYYDRRILLANNIVGAKYISNACAMKLLKNSTLDKAINFNLKMMEVPCEKYSDTMICNVKL